MTDKERNILIEWIEKQKNGFEGNCDSKGVIRYSEYIPKHYLDEFGNKMTEILCNWLATSGKDLILCVNYWFRNSGISKSLSEMRDAVKDLQHQRQELLELHPDPRISALAEVLTKLDESEYNHLVDDYCKPETLSNGAIILVLKDGVVDWEEKLLDSESLTNKNTLF